MDQDPTGWCEAHAEFFRMNGVSPEAIFQRVTDVLVEAWRQRTGLSMSHDTKSVQEVLKVIGGDGRPFCCRLGDEKLRKILISVSTDVEKMKEKQHVEN